MPSSHYQESQHRRDMAGRYAEKGFSEAKGSLGTLPGATNDPLAGLAPAAEREEFIRAYEPREDAAFDAARTETIGSADGAVKGTVPNSTPAKVHDQADRATRRFAAELTFDHPHLSDAERAAKIGAFWRRQYRELAASNAAAAAARVEAGQIIEGADAAKVAAYGKPGKRHDSRRRTPGRLARRDYQELAATLEGWLADEDTAGRTTKAAVATELAARMRGISKGYNPEAFLQDVAEERRARLETPYTWNSKQELMLADSVATVRSRAVAAGDAETVEAVDALTARVERRLHGRDGGTFVRMVAESPNR